MAWKEVQYRLTSSAPLLMHNGQLADPGNKWSKSLKKISGKRKKVDSDYEEMARLEFLGSLYMGKDGPILPDTVIESMVINAAKKSREGTLAKSCLYATKHAPLEYDGPREAADLWENEDFRLAAIVRVGTARVVRTRPKFEEWAATVTVSYEDSLTDVGRVDEWMAVAGTQVGLGDWRPKYGRFAAERISLVASS